MKLDDMDSQELDLLLRTLAALRDSNHKFSTNGDMAAVYAHRSQLTATEQARRRGVTFKVRKIENVIPNSKYL